MSGKPFTQGEIAFLKDNYPNKRTEDIAYYLRRPKSSVYNKAASLGIKKSIEFLQSAESGVFIKGSVTGKQFRFEPGHVPANKGKKMNSETYKKVQKTMFKKGAVPPNSKKNGEITIRRDKTGRSYLYTRISASKWKPLHRAIWESVHGAIPSGCNVIFKDGNPGNVDLINLELVTHKELMNRNTFLRYPEEIKDLIRAKAVLTRQINKKLNNNE